MDSSDIAGVSLAPGDWSVTVPDIIADEPDGTPMSGAVTVVELSPFPNEYICPSYEFHSAIMLSPITGPPPQSVVRSGTCQILLPLVMSRQSKGAPFGRGFWGECSWCVKYTLPSAKKATNIGQLFHKLW